MKANHLKQIQTKIKERRLMAGITQRALCSYANISQSKLCKFERGLQSLDFRDFISIIILLRMENDLIEWMREE